MAMFSLHTALYGPEYLRTLRVERAVLVTDPFFARSGVAGRIAAALGGQCRIFDGVQPEPELRCVAQGVALLREVEPELLLALGGGSAIDCAKGMLALCARRPTFVAIPTTSGTGSEVTAFAVLTHEGVKHPLVDARLRPDAAVLIPALLDGLPPAVIAEAGMDALIHCVEAVAARGASGFSTALASGAFATLLRLLPASYAGQTAVRAQVHEAAAMAGAAFDQAGLGACHALAHAVGGRFHISHGRLGGIFLPHVLRWNAQQSPAPYEALALASGLHGLGGLLVALTRLRRQLRLPTSLTAAGLSQTALRQAIEPLARAAVADPCAAGNPRPLTEQEAAALLRQAI